MSQRPHARDEDDRRRFVADPDALAELNLKLEQLSDPDVRSVVIRHEHPEFEEALKAGRREFEGSEGPMNPRLHLTMHEVVATQLWDDSPPEVWDTAVRLRDAGYERHEILHMLAGPSAIRFGERCTTIVLTIMRVTWPRCRRSRPPGSGSARPGPRRRATMTPANWLVGRRERHGGAIDGRASQSAPRTRGGLRPALSCRNLLGSRAHAVPAPRSAPDSPIGPLG